MKNSNYPLDAALAKPVSPDILQPQIIGIGRIRGLAHAGLGLGVQKSGRSTGHTRGRITVVGTTVNVGFGPGRFARFMNQIVTSKMGEPGDSGSLLLDTGNRAVGLLFAGSSQTTLYHPIQDVLDALAVRLTEDDHCQELVGGDRFDLMQQHCRTHADTLLQLPNVVGVGVGTKFTAGQDTGELCLTVLVTSKRPPASLRDDETIPPAIADAVTDVVESGEISATTAASWYGSRVDRKAKLRPARPGLSIGHRLVSAGTFGAVVYCRSSGEPLILSNNHVLANATDGDDGLAKTGDVILQPGGLDGGQEPGDVIGRLHRFVPLCFS